jgi:hypothetical protein
MKTWTDTPTTMALAYQEICSGEDPWLSLGNFTNDFFAVNDRNQRAALLWDPIVELPMIPKTPAPGDKVEHTHLTTELHRWAVFCAASGVYLCQTYGLATPDWVFSPQFERLPEPWFFSPMAATKPRVRERLEQETPETFKSRNIYCGARIFLDKRAEAEKLRQHLSV